MGGLNGRKTAGGDCRALTVAILLRAVLDAQAGDTGARAWLQGQQAAGLLDALGLDAQAVARRLGNGAGDGRADHTLNDSPRDTPQG